MDSTPTGYFIFFCSGIQDRQDLFGIKIEWSNALSVGIEELDDDHKYLIHLVHEFSGMAEDGRGVFLTDTVFSALLEYARVHFAREETAMAIGGYAFIDRHREDHKRLVETVVRIRDEFVMSPEGRARDRILALMQRWLVEHVMGADLDFRDAVRGHEAEIAAKLREMNMPVNWAKAGA